ncbi:MAG: alpha/beta hydrolase [Alphaproteobacteria bacterium]|nr:alpha/beta hydrolase [Alphaproteobacteria bacterium]
MPKNPFDPAAITPETAKFVAELEAQLAEMPATHEVPVDILRAARDEGIGAFPFHPPLDEAEEITFPPAKGGPGRVRVLRPKGKPTGVFLHIHGGGWTLGRPWHQDHRLKNIVKQTGCATVSIEYRLAPENPWPACVEDCATAARWLLAEIKDLFQTDRIVIGGESAGAHLAATTLLSMARENRLDRFHGALMTYGAYDMAMTPSTANWGARKLILSTPTVAWFSGNLAIPAGKMRDPLVSPLYGDLAGMPPALFQCGTYDPLLDDTAFMSARWAAAGSAAQVIWYPGGVHAFDYFDTALAAKAHSDGIRFLRRVFAGN